VLISRPTEPCTMQLAKEARQIGGGLLTLAVQRMLVDEAFGCAALRAAPLAPAYQRRVLQGLMQAAEEDGCELADPLVELFTAAQLVSLCAHCVSCWYRLLVVDNSINYAENTWGHGAGWSNRWRAVMASHMRRCMQCTSLCPPSLHGDAVHDHCRHMLRSVLLQYTGTSRRSCTVLTHLAAWAAQSHCGAVRTCR
jgi:ferredoxin